MKAVICQLLLMFTWLVTSDLRSEAPAPCFIEGYASQRSIAQGEEIGLHVSTSAATFAAEIYRIGREKTMVWQAKNLPGSVHVISEDASAQGCGWPVTFKVQTSPSWKSGYYEVKLRAEDQGGRWTHRSLRQAEATAWFIVRQAKPGETSKILLQLATNTYNAYTNWGGFSLYSYNSLSGNAGHAVSFHRPVTSQFSRWELAWVQWAESRGLSVEYAANEDLEFHPDMLTGYHLVVSVGHDEYWSAPMRDHLEAWIAHGGNAAFFSGNTCCWQIRTEGDGHRFTCWKQNYHLDPIFATQDYRTLSSLWSHHLIARSENQLTGVGFLWGGYRKSHGQFMDEPAEYEIHRPDHWVFQGTGLRRGDKLGGKDTIVGYECDGCELEWQKGLPYPTLRDGTPASFQVLATCPVRWHPDDAEWYEKWEKGRTGHACLGLYTQGGTVFTAGSTDWSHGLKGKDPAVEQITLNVLQRLAQKPKKP